MHPSSADVLNNPRISLYFYYISEKSSAKALNHLSLAAASDITKRQESLFLKATERPRSLPLHNRALDNVMQQQTANVNPFTPDSEFMLIN